MSEILEHLCRAARGYICGQIDGDVFRQEFAGFYYYARNHQRDEREANQLANKLIGPVAEFSGGHRSESSLRKELANAIRPFVQTEDLRIEIKRMRHSDQQQVSERPNRPRPNPLNTPQDFSFRLHFPARDRGEQALALLRIPLRSVRRRPARLA